MGSAAFLMEGDVGNAREYSPKKKATAAGLGTVRPSEPPAGSPGGASKGPSGQRPVGNDPNAGPVTRRRSRQRDAVIGLLRELDGFQTVREIHAALRGREQRVGLTTVYRIMQELVDRGEVDVVRADSGDGLYRLCGSEHHHHLFCRACGRTVEVSGPAMEAWTERIAEEHGFTEVGHSLEIIGTCSKCAAQAPDDRGTNGSE
jgi:Fur family ferric uptake transcriptional regulator